MSNLLDVLNKATDQDLVILRKEIDNLEVKLLGYKKAEKVLKSILGKEDVKQPKVKKNSFDIFEKRTIVARFLSDGPKNGQEIMANCKIRGPHLNRIMKCA